MKFFICTKDCIEACHLNIDDHLNFYPENRTISGKFVCGKLKKFLKKETDASIQSFYTTNNNLTTCSHEEATKEAASCLNGIKDKKILYIRGSGSLGYMNMAWDELMSNFPMCYFVEGSLCLDTGEVAHEEDFGEVTNPPVTNMENVDHIILFGRDAWHVAQHLYAYLKQLKKKRKKILYIDPVKSETIKVADDYIRINPATDSFLAAAILQHLYSVKTDKSIAELLDVCGISSDNFRKILGYIQPGNTAFITGFGLQRYSNGKNIVQWINKLAYHTDNLDYLFYDRASKSGLPRPKINNPRINISEILKKLEDGFFDAAVIVASNPLVSYPSNEKFKVALGKLNIRIVVDTNITETASLATHFIKVGGMFAQEDICGSYFYPDRMSKRDKIVALPSDFATVKAITEHLRIPFNIHIPETIPASTYKKRMYNDRSLPLLLPHKEKGLRLLTRSHYSYLNSQHLGDFKENYIYIFRSDAEELSLNDGDVVRIKNQSGAVTGCIKISDKCGKGYMFAYKCQNLIKGTPNVLTSFIPTDSGTGIALYDTFVEVEKFQ